MRPAPDRTAAVDDALAVELPPFADPLVRTADPAHDTPFAVTGLRARVTGGTGRGIDIIELGPLRALTKLRYRDAAAVEATLTPLGLERELRVGGRRVLERTFVPHEMPAAIVEWRAPDGAELHVSWRTDAPGPDGEAAFVFSEAPAEYTVTDARGAARRHDARLRIGPGGSIRLGILGTVGDAPLETTRRALRPDDLVYARAAAVRRLRRERLGVESPDPALNAAVAWGAVRIGPRTLGTASAALAVGDFAAAREVIRRLGERQLGSGEIPPAPRAPGDEAPPGAGETTADYLDLVVRYLAWTGDIAGTRTEWDRVRRAIAFCTEPADTGRAGSGSADATGCSDRTGTGPDHHGLDLRGLAVAAESIGDADLASRLRDLADRHRRQRTAAAPPAASPPPDPIVSFVHDVLGVEPDAPKHRLRLRPRLPDAWDRLAIRRIRMADTEIALDYRRDGDRHTFRVEQESGAVPVQVVLEPLLVARRVVKATVDGQAAELEPRPADGRILVPVQLVLDHERELVIDVAHDLDPGPTGLRVLRI